MAIQEFTEIIKRRNGDSVLKISDYLQEDLILFLRASDRDDALSHLAHALEHSGRLHDREEFYQALLEREKLVSTGIGMGVAIPHAKLEGYRDFFLAIGIQKEQGIEWGSLDGAPVRLIFMIGGPDDQQTKYLQILSRLTTAIKDEGRRKKLFKASSAKEVIQLFEGC